MAMYARVCECRWLGWMRGTRCGGLLFVQIFPIRDAQTYHWDYHELLVPAGMLKASPLEHPPPRGCR